MKESCYNVWVERDDCHYVFNGVSGGLLSVSREDFARYQAFLGGDEEHRCSTSLLTELVTGRMLIADDTDELALLANRYSASRNDASNFALTVVTSLGCNFDCPYCFEAKHPSIMDAEVQQALLSVLDDQLPKIRGLNVTWFGGEPLVGKEALLALSDRFIERCEKSGVEYSADIITNGYLLDEETCQQLAQRRVHAAQVGLDGPPPVHDRMRPLQGGRGTFDTILKNLRHAINYLQIGIRVNLDGQNHERVEELFRILNNEGFAGKLSVTPGHIVGTNNNVAAPSASFRSCLNQSAYAQAERTFYDLAARYGLAQADLPSPTGAPCTAVRANELVVGSRGELYKCWGSVGNALEVIGDIRDYQNPNGRLQRWLKYDPFANEECRGCIALPVCMGGCAQHAMDRLQYENRCGTFRFTYREQVLAFVERTAREGVVLLNTERKLARRKETR